MRIVYICYDRAGILEHYLYIYIYKKSIGTRTVNDLFDDKKRKRTLGGLEIKKSTISPYILFYHQIQQSGMFQFIFNANYYIKLNNNRQDFFLFIKNDLFLS